MAKIVAIDFDGCLCQAAYPDIGLPISSTIERMRSEQAQGTKFILWTCREGYSLNEALKWCAQIGLKFDAVNKNLDERIIQFGSAPRKVGADEYWDDKAVRIENYELDWGDTD